MLDWNTRSEKRFRAKSILSTLQPGRRMSQHPDARLHQSGNRTLQRKPGYTPSHRRIVCSTPPGVVTQSR